LLHSVHPALASRVAKQLIFVLSVLYVFSCPAARAAKVNIDPQQIKARSTAFIEEIIRGISQGDYGLYSGHFSKRMKESQTRESFLDLQRNLQKAIGKFQSLEYLGFYSQYGNLITLFKARFSKGKDDVLVRLVIDSHGPDWTVTGLWFDSPALEK
jgi:hypothetical protein